MKLLDTSFLIDYWAGEDTTEAFLEETADTESFISTTISIKELAVGRALQNNLDPAEFEATFGWVTFVPFRTQHAFATATIEADLRRRSDVNQEEINAVAADMLIAGVAVAEDASVVTRDTKDFDLFTEVTVEPY